jgi:hypothetical protein
MHPKQSYKFKTLSSEENNPPRCSTQYSSHKLTRGCLNYEQLKDAYLKTGETRLRTETN